MRARHVLEVEEGGAVSEDGAEECDCLLLNVVAFK